MNLGLVPRIHVERCTRFRFSYSECARCAEACPHGALQLSGDGVTVAAGACRHCGLCVGVCSTEVFESGAFARAALVRAATEEDAWTIACSPSGAPGDTTLPCLGALDAGTAAFLLSRGVRLTLAGLSHCTGCAHGARASAVIEALVAGVEHLRNTAGGEAWGALRLADDRGKGVDRYGAGRRQFFRRLVAGGAARLTAGEAESVAIARTAVRAAAHCRPAGASLIETVVGDRTVAAHPAVAMGAVAASAGPCTGCELCERVCPTGALRTSESDGLWQLTFHGHCTGCGVCVEACQPGALRMEEEIDRAHHGTRLHALSRTRCQGCGRIHVGGDPQAPCPVCAGDDLDFAAIFG